MKFTNKDLERLEALLEMRATSITVKPNKIKQLIKRLKVAEECIDDHRAACLWDVNQKCTCGYDDKLKVWLKVSGK
jgi:hypothetical protein